MPVFASVSLVFFVSLALICLWRTRYLSAKNMALRKSLSDTIHKKAELSNFMDLFSKNLRGVEEISEALNLTARYVTDYINAKAVCVFILEEDQFLHPKGMAGPFPPLHKPGEYVLTKPRFIMESLRHDKIKLGEGLVGEVAHDGVGVLLEDATSDPRLASANKFFPVYTAMAVPMKHEGQVVGVICAVNSQIDQPFTPEQFNSLNFMSSQVVLAYNIIKTYADLSRQQRLSQELEFARQLQYSLLPKDFPVWEPFVIHAVTRSAKEVSGDFYDFVEIDKNRLLVVVGDASGKGIPACMVMAMTRSFIRAAAERFENLSTLMEELNGNLYRDTDEGRFVTLSCCVLDRERGTVSFARAGHTELLIFSGRGGQVRNVCPSGTALGLLPKDLAEDFDTFTFSFLSNMALMIYSDGVTEASNPEGEEFGGDKLRGIFGRSCQEKHSPSQCNEEILREVDEFSREYPQLDDQTVVIISHQGAFSAPRG